MFDDNNDFQDIDVFDSLDGSDASEVSDSFEDFDSSDISDVFESSHTKKADSDAIAAAAVKPLGLGISRRALIVLTAAALLAAVIITALMNKGKKQEEDNDLPAVTAPVTQDSLPEEQSKKEQFARLYIVDDNTPAWNYPGEGASVQLSDYPENYIGGMFTGERSTEHDDMIMLDISGGKALVYSTHAIPVDNAKMLPLGAISQFDYYGGESACGAAVLTMMFGGGLTELIDYSDSNGYSDQGSLYSYTGGMTFEAMQRLAADRFGKTLVNACSSDETPSDTIKKLIDKGSYVIASVNYNGSQVSTDQGLTHFVLINGYMEYDGHTEFVYADSYTPWNSGISLDHVSAELLESSIRSVTGETVCIAYAE